MTHIASHVVIMSSWVDNMVRLKTKPWPFWCKKNQVETKNECLSSYGFNFPSISGGLCKYWSPYIMHSGDSKVMNKGTVLNPTCQYWFKCERYQVLSCYYWLYCSEQLLCSRIRTCVQPRSHLLWMEFLWGTICLSWQCNRSKPSRQFLPAFLFSLTGLMIFSSHLEKTKHTHSPVLFFPHSPFLWDKA